MQTKQNGFKNSLRQIFEAQLPTTTEDIKRKSADGAIDYTCTCD